ncbi:MAG: hypothetical protein CMJ74_13625 [Planctomycetaceae bacterium]|nr:hypothetical protein [Planctomycetaceae bacterium]
MALTFPTLISVYLLPFLAVVAAIHLIHLLRHQRVRWAAMDFLLESKRKNQTSVRLKQLLLLMLRLFAIAAIAFLLAGPILQNTWSRWLGGSKVHHVILIDDSGSMGDQQTDMSAFERGQRVIRSILELSTSSKNEQSITLLPFSAAVDGSSPEILREASNKKTPQQWAQVVDELNPTATGSTPFEAIEAIEKIVEPAKDESMILYVLSDFRTAQWQEGGALIQQLDRLAENGVQLELIQCVDEPHDNLAITELAPLPGPQVTGVALRMRVQVTNFGNSTARNIPVQLTQRSNLPSEPQDPISLGAIRLEKIEPGQAVSGFFDVVFQDSGNQIVSAQIADDSLALDNQRWAVVDVADAVPVLIIDDGGEDESLFLRLALAPSPQVTTGAQVQVERSVFLRDAVLDRYHAIFLINIANLDQIETERLEQYVRDGGGLFFFMGPQTDRAAVNQQLYRDGEGLFPLPLKSPATLLADRAEQAPALTVDAEHPIFARIFGGTLNNWLQAIDVTRYYAVDPTWDASEDPAVSVLARLRNGAPWIVEKKLGRGNVLAMLSTAAPRWHNWGLADPSFVLWALDTLVYLGEPKTRSHSRESGETLRAEVSTDSFRPLVRFTTPPDPQGGRVQSAQVAAKVTGPDPAERTAVFGKTLIPGVYEVRRSRLNGDIVATCVAFNPPASERDLQVVGEGQMRALLGDTPFQYRNANALLVAEQSEAGFPLGEQWWFFMLLAAVLIFEQWIAHQASYHRSGTPRGLEAR